MLASTCLYSLSMPSLFMWQAWRLLMRLLALCINDNSSLGTHQITGSESVETQDWPVETWSEIWRACCVGDVCSRCLDLVRQLHRCPLLLTLLLSSHPCHCLLLPDHLQGYCLQHAGLRLQVSICDHSYICLHCFWAAAGTAIATL